MPEYCKVFLAEQIFLQYKTFSLGRSLCMLFCTVNKHRPMNINCYIFYQYFDCGVLQCILILAQSKLSKSCDCSVQPLFLVFMGIAQDSHELFSRKLSLICYTIHSSIFCQPVVLTYLSVFVCEHIYINIFEYIDVNVDWVLLSWLDLSFL